jgi:hypothetical protein
MFSWENPDDRVAVVQMNSELRHARLELLSAECATHQLRLRFSTEDLARFAEHDLLRKAIDSAAALNDFYASIERQIPPAGLTYETSSPKLNEEQGRELSACVSSYLREQRDRYFPSGMPLSARRKATMEPFFSTAFLDRVRIVELIGERIPDPPFYSQAKDLGFANLPSFPQMASVTFLDVVVFNERIADRALFDGLVHTVQFYILGLQRYSDLFVRGFLRTNAHFAVPLEAHAFALASKFARNNAPSFSVEEQVRLWIREGRY